MIPVESSDSHDKIHYVDEAIVCHSHGCVATMDDLGK